VQGEDVGIPLDHQRPVLLRHRGAGPVEPVEDLRLVEEVGLRGVDVLRFLVVARRPASEAEDPPAGVSDREHDAGAEAVVLLPLLAALDEPDAVHLRHREARPLPGDEDLVPGTRREPDAEVPQRPLRQPARGEVLARLAGLPRLPEVVGVVGRGALEQLLQASAGLAARLGPRVLLLALQLDPVAIGQRLDRLGELQPLLLHHEAEDVPRDPAAEAVVELVLRVDGEGRRALVVERAEAHHLGAVPFEVGVAADLRRHVGGLADAVDALGGDPRH
jgi:hypothetical protein